MDREKTPHDSAYKQFFSNPEMVKSLLCDFVDADFVKDLDFTTLERCSGSYITDDLRERHDDIVWRVGWKNGSSCYVALILEFQSTQDQWMALRIMSYTALLLLDLIKTGKIKENLPPVFPVVIYNGDREWKAAQNVVDLFAPMPDSLMAYSPRQRYFLVDESRIPEHRLEESRSLAAQLIKLERAYDPKQIRQIITELAEMLQDPQYLNLRRSFTEWLCRVVFKRSRITRETPELHDLTEVGNMLEERFARWEEEYKERLRAECIAEYKEEFRAEGRAEGRAENMNEVLEKVLLKMLQHRFGEISEDASNLIAKVKDQDALEKFILYAHDAETPQNFVEMIKADMNLS